MTNAALTAAQWNASVRDNLAETAPAKATAAGQHFVATGANALAARTSSVQSVATLQSTTSTSWGDLGTVGPAVATTTGTAAFVSLYTWGQNNTAGGWCGMSYQITGATSWGPDDEHSIMTPYVPGVASVGSRVGMFMKVPVTAGSNTFTSKYRCGLVGTASFQDRHITVIAW